MKTKLISLLLILSTWQAASKFYDPIILPSVLDVAKSMLYIFKSGELYSSIFYSSIKLILGLFSAVFAGFLIGLGMAASKFMKNILHPMVVFLQSIPVISWILLALIWFVPDIIPILY